MRLNPDTSKLSQYLARKSTVKLASLRSWLEGLVPLNGFLMFIYYARLFLLS